MWPNQKRANGNAKAFRMRQKEKGKKKKIIKVVKKEINYLKMTLQITGERGGANK